MSGTSYNSSDPVSLFIYDSPRLRSHLFMRFLATNDGFHSKYMPYVLASMFGPKCIGQYLRHGDARAQEVKHYRTLPGCDEKHEDSSKNLTDAFDQARKEGKTLLANEHWFNVLKPDIALDLLRSKDSDDLVGLPGNPTVIPDSIYTSIRPIILIRNPIISIDSIYRDALLYTKMQMGDEDLDLIMSQRPLRVLFDKFRKEGRDPIVVDTEELVTRTDAITKAICLALDRTVKVEPSQFSDSWDPVSEDEIEKMNPVVRSLTANYIQSAGIIKKDTDLQQPSLDEQVMKWESKYSTDEVEFLRRCVNATMPDYKYLKAFNV